MTETTFITIICNTFTAEQIKENFKKIRIHRVGQENQRFNLLKIKNLGYTGKKFQKKYKLTLEVEDSETSRISTEELAYTTMGTYFLCEKCLVLRHCDYKASTIGSFCFNCEKINNRKRMKK